MSTSSYSPQELYALYRRWVIKNPNLLTDVETVATWSSYFIAGKINNSPIVSELVYAISKLISMFNDNLIKEAYEGNLQFYGLQDQMKVWLTVIHYCEVFVELAIKRKWGLHGKWTAVTLLQVFKCSMELILLYRFKVLPLQHPPIVAVQRKKLIEPKNNENNLNDSFQLKRSGRVIRRVDGAPPISLRDWLPVKITECNTSENTPLKDLVLAETLHVIKPIIHLLAMRMFSTQSWKQWLVSLCLDIASLKIYSKHISELSYEQRLEISRRKIGLILYLLRSPMYNGYSRNVLEKILKSTSNKIPMMSFICGPVLQYLNHWQDLYFYMWSS